MGLACLVLNKEGLEVFENVHYVPVAQRAAKLQFATRTYKTCLETSNRPFIWTVERVTVEYCCLST